MQIAMIVGPAGNSIPAQKIRTVYVLHDEPDGATLTKLPKSECNSIVGAHVQDFYVSHFETCPHASDFSHGASRS